MSRIDEHFFLIFLTGIAEMYCPVVLLLFLRRRTRSSRAAFVTTVVVALIAAFFLTGGESWLLTYYRVVIRGDTSVPDRCGRTVPEHLTMTFAIWGVYGMLCAGMGFGLWLSLWRLIHPRSFNRLTRRKEL